MGLLAALEEGVEHVHERVEVLVERRRLHAESAGHLGQAEAVDAVLGHHVVGDGEDLVDGLLPSPGSTVGRRSRAVTSDVDGMRCTLAEDSIDSNG